MSLSASVGTQIPTNVIEVGNEISQVAVDAIAASDSPSNINPMMTESAVTALGYIGDAPSDGSEYVRKNQTWSVATGGGGATAASQLTNATYTTNPAAAPTTAGDVLQFDGTALVWAAGGGGGGAAWGSITGTLSSQTDLQTVLDTKLEAKIVNTITTGPAGVQLSDARKVVYLASGGMGFQLSADNDASTPYVDGTEITIVVDNPAFGYSVIAGPGPVTINGGSSVSLTNYVSNLVKVAANTWFVS